MQVTACITPVVLQQLSGLIFAAAPLLLLTNFFPAHQDFESTCKGCKLCKLVTGDEIMVNSNNGDTMKIKPGSCCHTTGVIYAVIQKVHSLKYVNF